ncbi:serine/threonine protein kinase [Amycolatopsis pittospori]|uniref:serine/threonine protein kinase n=1 Tax=Amycolatopsis pittospori TaxID=2749434 RepID=UPI0015F02301|nr:hypothetical protein [Amycolatopsis pittospori]
MRPEDGEALGGGSAGDVYAVGDIALKVFSGKLYERTRHRLERELERLSALDGQILVPDAIEELPDGRCALRSELCTGSLLDLIETAGPLPVSDTLVLGSAIATTLAAAHEAGIVHGRLTPANVLFRATGEPVISDFERTLRPVFVRDPDHGRGLLAPDETVDERTDLYGLGVILHFALTGVLHDRPELLREDAPIDLLALTEHLLAEDPAARPAGAAQVAEILTELTAKSLVDELPEVPLVTIAPEEVPRKRSLWPVLTIGAAAVLVVTAWFVLPDSTEPVAQALPSPAVPSSPAKPLVELAAPADHGSMVDLSWQAPEGFDSAIVVAGETGDAKTTFVRKQRTARIPVEPGRTYCFQVQITDGGTVGESAPRPIRGALCRK